jgi:hypothetical protein
VRGFCADAVRNGIRDGLLSDSVMPLPDGHRLIQVNYPRLYTLWGIDTNTSDLHICALFDTEVHLNKWFMKYIFTCMLAASLISLKAQTPLCEVHHGCGGATVVAYRSDPAWTNITYMFQRLLGGGWVTIAESTENYHLVIPGDVPAATQYRTVLRNNATSAEQISNGVTVDPAKYNDPVQKPAPLISFYWGTGSTTGRNYVEVRPYISQLFKYRPPFTYTIKKKNGGVFDQKISTTGIFFTNNIEVNQEYVITVTDYCGQVDSTSGFILFKAKSRVTARNCSGASIEFSEEAGWYTTPDREPVKFGVAPLADNIDGNNVPESILSGLSYSYSAGIVPGFTAKRYVVRARDAFGSLSLYSVVSTGLTPGAPSVSAIGTSGVRCTDFVKLSGNPQESGIRRIGDTQPYTFTPGDTIKGIAAGYSYEMVCKDSCGRISEPLVYYFPPWVPIISDVAVTRNGCSTTVTVTAATCTNTPEYRLQLTGEPAGDWQSSNVFNNVKGSDDWIYTLFVRDGEYSLLASRYVNIPQFFEPAYVSISQLGGCGAPWKLAVGSYDTSFQYAISVDGTNYSPFTFSKPENNDFDYRGNIGPGCYDVQLKNSCGQEKTISNLQAGDWYYANEIGVTDVCANANVQAGGFIKFGIQEYRFEYSTLMKPYHYQLKEVTSVNGSQIQYGNVVRSGQTDDTTFTISGLEPGKGYGIFINNKCGEAVTPKNRAANYFFIPAASWSWPQPAVVLNTGNCNQPYIEVSNLPTDGIVTIYKGRDTTGTLVSLSSPTTSTVLDGGYYSIKVSTTNFNGCSWMQLYERYVRSADSTLAGTFNNSTYNSFYSLCKADSGIVDLKRYTIGQTPGGTWSGTMPGLTPPIPGPPPPPGIPPFPGTAQPIPDINWVNRDSGQFRTIGLPAGNYTFEYTVQSLCGENKQLAFTIPIGTNACRIGGAAGIDVISANSLLGCKNYAGDIWYDVLDQTGSLRFSINPGNGNSIESACWGARVWPSYYATRTISLNDATVYFSASNFYIEPNQLNLTATPVRVRLYYSNYEIYQFLYYLRNNGFPLATVNDLRILKKKAAPGSPVDLDVSVNPGTSPSLYSYITPSVHRIGNGPFPDEYNYYFEFEISSFSELALVSASATALPVTWLSVSGQVNGAKILINWATASESNTASFTIEHSPDGLKFISLENVPAAGNSSATRNYQYLHGTPKTGVNYYRIRQTDKDGKYSYSKTIKVNFGVNGLPLTVAPNPASDQLTVFLPLFRGNATIRIFNTLGQVVQQQQVANGAKQLQLNISTLKRGYYRLQLLESGNSQSIAFIKQ